MLGLWLVHEAGHSYGQLWVIASLVLLVLSSAAGRRGGEREAETRRLALRLAAEGDAAERGAPPRGCATRSRSPCPGAPALGSLAILALMIWKPGA